MNDMGPVGFYVVIMRRYCMYIHTGMDDDMLAYFHIYGLLKYVCMYIPLNSAVTSQYNMVWYGIGTRFLSLALALKRTMILVVSSV